MMEIDSRSSGAFVPKPYAVLLTEKDVAAIETLRLAGLSRSEATVLYALYRYSSQADWLDSHWLERICDLRQSEVSIALGNFIQSGLLAWVEVRGVRKGRPIKVYHVKGDIPKYIHNLIWIKKRQLDQAAAEIDRILGGVA